MTHLAIIVAVADNGAIGKGDALPWKLSEDMQYFKRVTMGKPIVMGRKTYESIGKPLPGRTNIVISRNAAFSAEGVEIAHSLDEALAVANRVAVRDGAQEILVIGGAQIYSATIPSADTLYITEVHANVEGDTVLCDIEWKFWRETARDYRAAKPPDTCDYSFVCYERVRD